MAPTDIDYYRQRAAAERELMAKAANPDIAAIHERLARSYDLLADSPERRGMLSAS